MKNLNTIILLLATVLTAILFIKNLPDLNWENLVSLFSAIIFGMLFFRTLKKDK